MRSFLLHFSAVVGVWLIGFIAFSVVLPQTPARLPVTVDAIVVLTGDSARISAGFQLYETDIADKLFISGVYPGTNMIEIARPYLSTEKTKGIELDDRATNTRENAIETAKWLKRNEYDSIILVTSNYHMRRAWVHFKNQMPDLKMTPYPVISNDKTWFTHYGGIRTMVRAYNKLIVTLPIIGVEKIITIIKDR